MRIYVYSDEVVVTGNPDAVPDHNCDAMDCGMEHVVARVGFASPTALLARAERAERERDSLRTQHAALAAFARAVIDDCLEDHIERVFEHGRTHGLILETRPGWHDPAPWLAEGA